MATTSLYDDAGRVVGLGSRLGEGGEAVAYRVSGRPDVVAKVYKDAVLSPERAAKVAALPAVATPGLRSVVAWATGTLYDRPVGGAVRGILLPFVPGREIHNVCSPAVRRQLYPASNWSFLVHVAMNAAAAVQTVHEAGCLIADLNQGGFFVTDQGTVKLIECDSFQFRHQGRLYRCPVRVDLYQPPELFGADLKATDATASHDSFSLGVLLFQLLFLGRHPFAGVYTGPGNMEIQQAIRERRFAFSTARLTYQMDVPPLAPALQLVPPAVADLFERAFRGTGADRPTAADWYQELHRLRVGLRACRADPSHSFPDHRSTCPWCQLEQAGLPPLFGTTAAVSFEFDPGFDFEAFWREVERLPPVPELDALTARLPPRPAGVRGRDLPIEAQFRRLGAIEQAPPVPRLNLVPVPELPTFRPSSPDDQVGGYVPELEPVSAPFTPEAVGPDPVLTLRSEPPPPGRPQLDRLAGPRERAAALQRKPEYRTAKWATVGLLAVAAVRLRGGDRIGAGVSGALGAGFAFVWVVLAVRIRLALAGELRAARDAETMDEDRHRRQLERYQADRIEVEVENNRRRSEHGAAVAELNRRRADLPRLNAERRQTWEVNRAEIEWQAGIVRGRNADRLRAWQTQARVRDADRRHAWEVEVIKVEAARQRADDENRLRRVAWTDAVAAHGQLTRAVAEANARRNAARAAYAAEVDRRELAQRQAETAYQQAVDRWAAAQPAVARLLADERRQLDAARVQYLGLRSAFEAAKVKLTSDARRLQLEDYLRHQLVEHATIAQVGDKRKAVLSACGIETAFDITDRQLVFLVGKGFGPVAFENLKRWRQQCEREFIFDPRRHVSPPELRQIQAAYRAELAEVKATLHDRLSAIRQHLGQAVDHFQQASDHAEALATDAVQRDADVTAARDYGTP